MPEVVIVHNPPFPLFKRGEGRNQMARKKRKRRKHSNRGRGRRRMYNRRRRTTRRKKYNRGHARKRKHAKRGKKRGGAYARFAKSMWSKHRAHYKKIGFKRAGKEIGAAWRAKH